jgi:hypothetical protein
MTATFQELVDFQEFAVERLRNGGAGLSLEALLDQWRALHPSEEELRDSVAAVKQALDDMDAGDTGRPVDEVLRDLRAKYNLPQRA